MSGHPPGQDFSQKADEPRLELILYVAGEAPNSQLAHTNVTRVLDQHFAGLYKLEIIDVLEDPLRALQDGILVTPTLLKVLPKPEWKLIGNLNNQEKLLFALGVGSD